MRPAMTKFIGYPAANHEQAEGLAAADAVRRHWKCSQQTGTRTAAAIAASSSFRSRRARRGWPPCCRSRALGLSYRRLSSRAAKSLAKMDARTAAIGESTVRPPSTAVTSPSTSQA